MLAESFSSLSVVSLWCEGDESLPLVSGHSCTQLQRNSSLFYTFGGYTSEERVRDAFSLSVNVAEQTCSVSRLKIPLAEFSGRAGHVSGAFGDSGKSFLGFGYDTKGAVLSDCYLVDLVTDELILSKVENVSVAERRWAAHCVVDNNTMFVHGGWNDGGPLDDAVALDVRTQKWNKFETKKGVSLSPSARRWHTANCEPQSHDVIVVGGYDGKKHYSDCWIFDFRAAQWRQVKDTKVGRARHMACAGVVFGGYDSKSNVLGNAIRTKDFCEVICPFELKRAGGAVSAMNDESFVLVGGFDAQNTLTNQVYVIEKK